MKQNMGNADRLVRILVTLGVVGMYLGSVVSGTTAIILGALAVILALTSTMGFCPLYFPFKFSTKRTAKAV